LKIWRNYLINNIQESDIETCKDSILHYTSKDKSIVGEDQALNALIIASESWIFQIASATIETRKNRVILSLNRSVTFKYVLQNIQHIINNHPPKDDTRTIHIDYDNDQTGSITQFRLEIIAKILKNLISKYTEFVLTNESIAENKILLTTRSNFKTNEIVSSNVKIIKCGVVTNQNELQAESYLEKRRNDIHLLAIHRHGMRAKDNQAFVELMEKVGNAAAIFDMIETKHSNAMKLTSNPKHAFILYNSARIETLLANFYEKVSKGYYPALPALNDIDTSLLTEEEEWELLKLIISFPDVIEKSIEDVIEAKVAPHVIYRHLLAIVNVFSGYYNRRRLLTENRANLIPVLHAKIHLLQALRTVFNATLEVFEIEPVLFM
jgi:hypothetical protein